MLVCFQDEQDRLISIAVTLGTHLLEVLDIFSVGHLDKQLAVGQSRHPPAHCTPHLHNSLPRPLSYFSINLTLICK